MSISTGKLGRRAVLQGLLGMGLTGCGVSPSLDLVARTIAGSGPSTDSGYPLSSAQILASPYASLGVKIGGGHRAILTLASYQGSDLCWISADRALLVTRAGRLVKTVGMTRDLVSTEYRRPDPIFEIARTGISDNLATAWRSADFSAKDEFGVDLVSNYEVIGPETLTIIGYSYSTMKIREHVSVQAWRWSHDNYFWVSPETGILHRARQRYCPQAPSFELEVLKPAAPPPA